MRLGFTSEEASTKQCSLSDLLPRSYRRLTHTKPDGRAPTYEAKQVEHGKHVPDRFESRYPRLLLVGGQSRLSRQAGT